MSGAHVKKRLFDPIHGFIPLGAIEEELINSVPFQRLRYIRQLGVTYFVYPGASHCRFEHSLGVMHVASRIFDQITQNCSLSGELAKSPVCPFGDFDYFRLVIRLAALCHDLGHLPFSHVAENRLLGKEGHEQKTIQIIESAYLAPIWKKVFALYPGKPFVSDLIKVAIGQKKLHALRGGEGIFSFSSWDLILAEIIAGDFFGADRIDYLLRDAQCTGVAYGLFDYEQLITTLMILPVENRLVLGIAEDGLESAEALLLARHFMHKRVYKHHSVKAFSFHLDLFMAELFKDVKLENIETYLEWSDNEVLVQLTKAASEKNHPLHGLAKPFFDRAFRCSPCEISPLITKQQLEKALKELFIPEDKVHYELFQPQKAAYELTFPALRRNGEIVCAKTLSQVSVQAQKKSSIYLPKEQIAAFQEKIKKTL